MAGAIEPAEEDPILNGAVMGRSLSTIVDPAGIAKRQGADGYGITWAVVAGGVQGSHPHFLRYENLELGPARLHRDFTSAFEASDDGSAEPASLDEAALAEEALVDRHGHGTHVAGVIAGFANLSDKNVDWDLDEACAGVAPRCKLLSLKVLDDQGQGDERAVLAAFDYVASLNADADTMVVHGVLVPLGLTFDEAHYPCGGSPVCEGVRRLVDSGVVVVVPAGNEGRSRSFSIMDPGNAEPAITVGASRGFGRDHLPAYFSSRGPTSDGRSKPDLLAPGWQVLSSVPPLDRGQRTPSRARGRGAHPRLRADYRSFDGTSMAAAVVAGAAAAVLSVRPDLIGRPDEVKKLLLDTATDLGRDRYVQGRGLINLSRALDENVAVGPGSGAGIAPAIEHLEGAPAAIMPPDSGQVGAAQPADVADGGKRFAVAFSYAGEHDDYVRRVWKALRQFGGLPRRRIFYHKTFEGELGRLDLDDYLQEIYGEQSELIVVFLSKHYLDKEWTGLEWRVLKDVIKRKRRHAVLPVRFDDTHIPGLFSIDGYVPANDREPEDLADIILDRLEANREGRR